MGSVSKHPVIALTSCYRTKGYRKSRFFVINGGFSEKNRTFAAEYNDIKKMVTPVFVFIAFVVVALVGWGVAELKARTIHFEHSEEEREEAELLENERRAEGFEEKNVHDIMRSNSTKGFNAVG